MNIIGHKKQIEFLKKSLETGNVSQAYLFSGPESVGKFLIAKNFANNMVFGGLGGPASGWDFSVDIDEKVRSIPNFIFLEPRKEEKKGVVKEKGISIDEVRSVQKKLSTFPSEGKFNVLIINNAHKMNQSAQNALLKTLEEPNSSSVIILVAHREGDILQTIKSRCVVLRFSSVTLGEIEKDLREAEFENSNELSFFSMGRPGRAVELGRNAELFSSRKKEYAEFRSIFRSDVSEKLEWAEKNSKNVSHVIETLELWVWFLRVTAYKSLGDQKKLKVIYDIIEKIENAARKLKDTNANGRLVLENLLINF